MKTKIKITMLVMGVLLLTSGCALLPSENIKKVNTRIDPITNEVYTETEYNMSDYGAYYASIEKMVTESVENLVKLADKIASINNCSSYSGEARAWCSAATSSQIQSVTYATSTTVTQVVSVMKQPLSAADVWNNAIERNTIALLGAMGVTGWAIEAISGSLGSAYNISTEGGAITDSMNDVETHFTGLGDGSTINVDVMRRSLETITGVQ